MRAFLMASGPTIFRAPEADEGADYEVEIEDAGEDEVEDDEIDEAGDDEDDADRREEDDGAEDGDEEEQQAPVAKKGRGANRVAEATRIAAEAKAEADNLKRELAAIRAESSQRQQQESAQQRAERLALMDPEERTEYRLREQEQAFQQRLNAIEFRAQDSADRTAFEGLCARNPVAQKLAKDVEAELGRLRGLGNNYAREVVLKYIIGEKALAAEPRARAKQERGAAANRARQAARPGSSRGDVPSDNGRGGSEAQRRAKRLDGMQI